MLTRSPKELLRLLEKPLPSQDWLRAIIILVLAALPSAPLDLVPFDLLPFNVQPWATWVLAEVAPVVRTVFPLR